MMEIIEKYSITLIQSIFGILIFQVVMMNMAVDIINYIRVKEGKENQFIGEFIGNLMNFSL